jgi:hypothetical protein
MPILAIGRSKVWAKRVCFYGPKTISLVSSMNRVELFTVADTFWLGGSDFSLLILHPDFSVPQQGWTQRTEPVLVVKPDGQRIEATAQFNMTHFNISDASVSIDRRWRLTVSLTDRKKEEIPIGSKILVSKEVRDAILPGNVT